MFKSLKFKKAVAFGLKCITITALFTAAFSLNNCDGAKKPRPVYIFAHRANDLDDINDAINHGANAIEFDLQLCGNGTRWEINHLNCGGSTTLQNWLDHFKNASNNSRIAAIAFDIKAGGGVSKANMERIVQKARASLPSDILIIYGVGAWDKRSNIEKIMYNLKANEAVTIDMTKGNNSQQIINFFKNAGIVNNVYGDGYAANFSTPSSVWTNTANAVKNRDGAGDVKLVYSWTYEKEDSIRKVLISKKMNGILVNDCSIYCVNHFGGWFGGDDGLENALEVVNENKNSIRKANRGDLSSWGFVDTNSINFIVKPMLQ